MKDNAVSPVIGVMLMLVVTIIIAAMVSAFSGSVVRDETLAPQVTLAVSYTSSITDEDKENGVPDHGADFKPNNGIAFRLSGGDSFSLRDITIQLRQGENVINFDMNTYLNSSAAVDTEKVTIVENPDGNDTYFGLPGGGDELITVGDSFMIVADDCYDSTMTTDATIVKGRFLTWSPEDSGSTFRVQTDIPFKYTITDQLSGKPMQSGTIILR
ncbi:MULTISPECIES: type IV pilin N-terminal domain-containing protein [unclassified Methanoculleus]|jgi:flagellin-like protein|uniref:Type IV pilin N-terminal domain-containing protein n=1 Tax=Methanoculleus palmolei TaxID=72612 RepID=A0ABD8A796_9EURY|nr:type IV pilin N-terminal domain-containing protein [Methanoculleus sp. UBA377]MDD2473834.1 type IV pilin N-terminal domain-containing protein [Methanoculleus sp.]WOX54898.1 type IV pilin N-terminal domain-containing protein [Methanoculleus palmolei]